mmetsp:Transcript_10146/g.16873  ORF Transcript_10146/g.16873 Transcript_10146/m.16873 type:complete len:330 (+) Transcript_10146:972-1961(+)
MPPLPASPTAEPTPDSGRGLCTALPARVEGWRWSATPESEGAKRCLATRALDVSHHSLQQSQGPSPGLPRCSDSSAAESPPKPTWRPPVLLRSQASQPRRPCPSVSSAGWRGWHPPSPSPPATASAVPAPVAQPSVVPRRRAREPAGCTGRPVLPRSQRCCRPHRRSCARRPGPGLFRGFHSELLSLRFQYEATIFASVRMLSWPHRSCLAPVPRLLAEERLSPGESLPARFASPEPGPRLPSCPLRFVRLAALRRQTSPQEHVLVRVNLVLPSEEGLESLSRTSLWRSQSIGQAFVLPAPSSHLVAVPPTSDSLHQVPLATWRCPQDP